MKTDIYFYSGTGNSLWTARRLAEELGDTTLHPISNNDGNSVEPQGDAVGFVFPVHMWGLPGKVLRFLDILKADSTKYYFAAAVNAGQVAATLLQLQKIMQSKGMTLSAGYDMVMPTNYVPWGGPGPEEKYLGRISRANEKIKRIAGEIRLKKILTIEKGSLWQNVFFSLLYKMAIAHVSGMDKSFWVDEKCNSCGICEKVCPAPNITIFNGKPEWLHRCEQCLACIQWCPQKAIQYGKKTPGYERYHHPDVKLSDIIACAPGKK
jgi:ferredoxin